MSDRRAGSRFRRGSVFVVSTVVAGVIGTVVTYYVTRVLTEREPVRPIAVNVNDEPPTIPSFTTSAVEYVMPAGLRPAAPLPSECGEIVKWVKRHGGVSRTTTMFRVIVQGRTDAGVLIENMRARVVKRATAPKGGTAIGCGAGQGEAEPRNIAISLDGLDPTAKYSSGVPGRKDLFGFTLAKGETEIFDITATTGSGTVTWVISLDLVVQGERTTVEVLDNGKPFVTTAAPGARFYNNLVGTWYECPPTAVEDCRPVTASAVRFGV
ncbi:hypothetical protein [Sphaerisporangium aureirubrum]|uniref:GerMN domain-containing protein n=1 Tax=Sphaerisporangium aureirubrum TaxID=1544736 RepID=A0ABW1NEK6_9ACTN